MPINIKRLQNFARGATAPGISEPVPMMEVGMGLPLPEMSPGDMFLDNPDNLKPEAMLHRLREPQVNYKEIDGSWGDGGCGGCRFFSDGFCVNKRVMSYVAERGTCGFFNPATASMVDVSDWEALSAMDYDPLKLEEDSGELGSVNDGKSSKGKGEGGEGDDDDADDDDEGEDDDE